MSIWHISAAQSKVREATSNDLPLPSGKQMNELAQMSYHQPDFVEIMEVLDMRLNEKGKNWKQLYKALVVLDYLLHWGSENVVAYFKDNICVIKNLREFQHVDDRNDGGIIVRHKAKDVTNLLEDEELLRNVRMNHASMHDRPMSGDPTNGSDLERRSTTPAYSDSSHTSSKRPLHVPPNSEESSEASHISDPAHDISLSQGNLSAAKARINKSTRPQRTLVSSTSYGPSNAPTRPSLSAASGGERSFPLYPASVRSYLEYKEMWKPMESQRQIDRTYPTNFVTHATKRRGFEEFTDLNAMMKFLDVKSEDELAQKVSSAKIYQRTIAYVYVQLKTSPMRHSSLSALDSLGRALASWDAWDAGQWLVKHHTIRSTLWEILNNGTSSHAHNSRYFDLQNLLNSDLLTIQSLILTVLSNRDKKKAFFGMCSADPVPVLNLLQTILDRGDLSKDDQPRFARTLARLVKSSSCLPDCLMLSGVQRTGKDPVAGGGFADVWTGYFGPTPVAIKALRIYDHSNQEKALRDFAHEAIIWRLLRHPNILKFYGVFRGDDRLCLVSPWMSAGNIVKYLENNPKSDRLALLGDVVNGLAYLHDFQPAIIHGDLKGANIFVTSTRTACLGDFGLSSFRDSQESTLGATTGNTTGTLRWQAPELFDSFDDGGTTRPSQESDIYSFGCVCLELMTGKPPFMEIRRDGAVMKAIMNGQTPRRPVGDLVKYGLDDKLWAVMEKCWSHDPTQRPEIEALLAYFDKSRESAIEDNSIEDISHEIRASLDQYGFPEDHIRFLPKSAGESPSRFPI